MKKLIVGLLFLCFQSFAALTYYHVDVASSGGGDGSTWTTSGGTAAFTLAEYIASLDANGNENCYFIKAGTYTLTGAVDVTADDGTVIAPRSTIGVKATTTNVGENIVFSDYGRGVDRPFFDCGVYTLKFGDFFITKNISFQGEGNPAFTLGASNVVVNCSFDNDYSSTSSRNIATVGSNSCITTSTFTSLNTKGLTCSPTAVRVLFNVFENISDATNGIALTTSSAIIVCGNKFTRCKIAIETASNDNGTILNNSFFACGTDLNATDAYGFVVVNNVHDSTKSDAYKWTTVTPINYFAGNHGDDTRCVDMFDGVAETGIYSDLHISTGNPLFANPPDSLQLETGSPCLNTGLEVR